ncbi:hypothetical protein O181_069104 [Austropuccinia psidii MF-1]|uniref:Uncharacterized protein n=1 Tax=Austropuccinia psidii MF-1 TaxID=1389203 RepID=A0A9Q3I875_9BASI|nr:hypothetical protein [Austropuccinia psidii MF-1]
MHTNRSKNEIIGWLPSQFLRDRSIFREEEDEEGWESVEGQSSDGTGVQASLQDAPKAPEAPSLELSNQPLVSQAEPILLKIMAQITRLGGQLPQEVSQRDNSKGQQLNSQSIKPPDTFHGTQNHKLRGCIQS